MFEIGIGALTALVEKNNFFIKFKNKIIHNFFFDFLNSIFLIALILCFFYLNEKMNLPNYYTLIPIFCCSFIILFNDKKFFISKILSNKFSSLTGKISYGMYLYHFPIIIFFNYFGFDKFKSLLIIVIFSISYISWKYFETPFRNKNIISKNFLIVFILCSILIFIANFMNREVIKNYLGFSIPSKYQKIIDKTKRNQMLF